MNMMVSITAWSKRSFDWLRPLLAAGLLAIAGLSGAAEVEIESPQFFAYDEGYAVSGDFRFELGQRLEEAVTRGVVLYFVTEFELTNPRWFWFDEKILSRQMRHRLYYHALTRQYRLAAGGLHQSFFSLDEALRVLSRLRSWQVIEKMSDFPQIKPGENYHIALRFRLDVTQLPKPFQISAVANRDWQLSSDWKSWPFNLPPVESK